MPKFVHKQHLFYNVSEIAKHYHIEYVKILSESAKHYHSLSESAKHYHIGI